MIRVLFVCMGNICRSPIAEAVFRQLVRNSKLENRIDIDSAGTHADHLGETPDSRAVEVASERGINLTGLVARRVAESDFSRFDHILAMDRSNLEELQKICPVGKTPKLRLLLDSARGVTGLEVPDPYYGTLHDYRQAMDLIDTGTRNLLTEIMKNEFG